MIARRTLLAAGLALAAAPAFAIDPGTASGHFARDGQTIAFKHAIAISQDNTEGLLDHGPQVRLLLSDREAPAGVLYGAIFPPVRAMAGRGEIRGVLVEFSPTDKTQVHVTVLDKPSEPGAFAPSLSISNSEGLWTRLDAGATRIAGEYKANEQTDLAFSFSAPLFTDPVQADLKGADAQKSEQVRVLLARAQAIGRGDMPAALALSSHQSGAELSALPADQLKMASAQIAGMTKALKAAKRVVVRRETAVVMTPDGSFFSLVFEDGAWKAAD